MSEVEVAISVHPFLAHDHLGQWQRQSRMLEFQGLVEASDCCLQYSKELNLRQPHAGRLIGSGQLDALSLKVAELAASVVFVDHALSPVQQRNLEKALDAKVVDRTGLILEIFAARARTREGVLQVELASLNYQISRLVRSWTHLERQRGGVGFLGGPGESQIELDRRMIRMRIKAIERDLQHVRGMRRTQRSGRKRRDMPLIALVGYTNAGKSTLFNRLTASHVFVADQLFATLDPTIRGFKLSTGDALLLSDTVGFVQDLPHELVDAFRSTLEEVIEADLILHVCDASDPCVRAQNEVVRATLRSLGISEQGQPPIIDVWNKSDLCDHLQLPEQSAAIHGRRIAVSAVTGAGFEDLEASLLEWLGARQDVHIVCLRVPAAEGKVLAWCHQYTTVLSETLQEDVWHLRLRLANKLMHHIEKWMLS